ncbi:MAG: NUDIX domain-containing protein [Candidatus Kerfeldbacteria bacterium]|nr:NUDIX domain-containing protein [Candidatus Kerfeldbacteria bacterium]
MIMKDGKVLLGRRHSDAEKAGSALHGEGTWTLPGGKVHFGETLYECAAREVEEETGIKVKSMEIVSVGDDMVPDAHFVSVAFLCTDYEGEPEVREPDKIVEWQWFEPTELPSPMYFPSKRVIENFLAKRVYGVSAG